ncbi:MAG: chemotaxis protein CheW [Phormidesmis sp.]
MLLTQNETTSKPVLSALGTADAKTDPLGLIPLPVDNRQRFLRLRLSQRNDTLLPLDQILEVLQLPVEDIFPVPDVSSSILGVCSWRGETLWLVDLNHLVGYTLLCQQVQTLASVVVIIVQHDGRSLGLAVEQAVDVDLFDEQEIRMESGLCPPELEPFVSGYCPQQGGTVLNVSAIVNAPQLQSHRQQLLPPTN